MSITTPLYQRPDQPKAPRLRVRIGFCATLLLGGLAGQRSQASDTTPPKEPSSPPPSGIAIGPGRKVSPYKLESMELRGSDRMTAGQLMAELGLAPGLALDDQFVMTARARILGLGLFKSAMLMMRRGTQPGYAKLIIEVEDDPTVLTDWALGGDLAVTVAEDNAYGSLNNTQVPMDYRLGLVSRNAFWGLHRAAFALDVDYTGSLRSGQVAYGLPRFTHEAAQFDAEASVVDPTFRYLDTLGFGGRGQGLWSVGTESLGGDVQYGAAMYVNLAPRFALRGYPAAVAGPKFGYYEETRLRRFFLTAGHRIAASVLVSPLDPSQSIAELSLAQTATWFSWAYLTGSIDALTVGVKSIGVRVEGRIDIPLTGGGGSKEQAGFFLRLRGGEDRAGPYKLAGSSAMAGVRYHSAGFIAELAFRITNAPPEILPKNLPGSMGGSY